MRASSSSQMNLSRHGRFLKWFDEVTPDLRENWVETIKTEIGSYAPIKSDQIRYPVGVHLEALRHFWDTGLSNRLNLFYSDLARKRLAEDVPLADVVRAVSIGERILLRSLDDSNLQKLSGYKDLVSETFREGTFMLLDCFGLHAEERAEEARTKIEYSKASAEKMHEQWSLLNQILAGMSVGIVLFNEKMEVVWLNRNIPHDLLTVRPELAIGRPCSEVLNHDTGTCSKCPVSQVFDGDTPMRDVVFIKAANGGKRYLKQTRPISAPGLEGRHVMEIYVDTTDLEEAQRSLARTQEFVRNLLNSSVNAIIATDVAGNMTLFNKTAEDIFGFREEEVLGKAVSNFYEKGRTEAIHVMRRLVSDEILENHTTRFKGKMGGFIPVRATFSMLRDERGKVIGTMAFCQDTSKEEALKREVRDKERYLFSILQGSMDGLVTLDSKDRITSWNRGAAEIFGVESEMAIGSRLEDFLPPEAVQELPWTKTLPEGLRHCEMKLRTESGNTKELLITRTTIRHASGGYAGASIVLKDITELKRLQRELAEAEHLAELGQLAASVAHEIKNPIAGLKGAMEMMKEQYPVGDPAFSVFQEGIQQMKRLDNLVNDLLTFAKPFAVKIEAVPLELVVDACLPAVTGMAGESGVKICVDISKQLPLAMADPQRLQQVILNLLINAIQAMPDGGELFVTAYREGDKLALAIRDSGIGIEPDCMKDIFKPFFSTKHIGSGLGLSIVRRIINAHGGRVEVESQPGCGTTFTVWVGFHNGDK